MFLPQGSHADGVGINSVTVRTEQLLYQTDDSATRSWSSIIGIICAIIGNILISFALNTQRYAHVQLGKEQRREEAFQDAKRSTSYGTLQGIVAEERANAHVKASMCPPLSSGDQNVLIDIDEVGNETGAVIPRVSYPASVHSRASGSQCSRSDGDVERKSYLRSPYWWTGIVLMVVGEAGNFLAYGFAPASIVSPLGVVAIISNCLIAPIMLKEEFRKRDLLGVVIAVAGVVTVVLSAKQSNPKLGPGEIWTLISQWEFETYLGITIATIIVLMVLSNKYGQRTIVIDVGLVGLFGGYTALSTKGVASLLSYRLWNTLTFPITYLLITILVVTAVLQIKYVNRALQRFDSTQVIPTQFVMFTISVIVGSAILYRDFEATTVSRAIKFVGGCAMTFLGVWSITSGRGGNSDIDELSLEDREDSIDMFDDEIDQQAAASPLAIRSLKKQIKPKQQVSAIIFDSHLASASCPALIDSTASSITAPQAPAPIQQRPNTTSTSNPQAASSHREDTTSTSLQSPNQHHSIPQSQQLPPSPFSQGRPHTSHHTSDIISPPTARTPLQRTATGNPSPRLTTRGSITGSIRIRPGLLTTPLSSSFSAIVADSLRRGEGAPPTRRRSVSGRGGGSSADHSGRRGGRGAADGAGRAQRRSEGAEERAAGASSDGVAGARFSV